MDETTQKIIKRLQRRSLKKEFIGDLIIEIWEHIEEYRKNGESNENWHEVTYDKMFKTLFAHLAPYLDMDAIEERDKSYE